MKSSSNATTLRRGEVAAQAGVHIETLRYYERRGLLPKPARSAVGYRRYSEEAVRIVRFIKRAQELGFTLREVGQLLQLRETEPAECAEVRTVAEEKIRDIEKKIRDLRAVQRALRALVESCAANSSARVCPILEALEETTERTRVR
ncbi:MAG: Hg(II)-responsive transcriptional regulator [Candidatus Binatia bacterium]|nr:MAG: Hg(II)-responsive transcriptional regulator [Candidatus Binatia bacterium]